MPRNARCVVPETAYHLTQRGTNQGRVFFSASDRLSYLRLLKANLEPAQTRVLAWCLMSNHMHLVVVPGQEDSLEVLLRPLHGRYAQMVNAKRLRSGHLWQNRFFSCALSESHLRRVLAYVEQNPVRAGLVQEAQEYQWSSASAHLGLSRDRLALCDTEIRQAYGGVEGWRALLGQAETNTELRLLRRCTYAGRPFGEESFVASMEERFQRKWRRWSFEQKE